MTERRYDDEEIREILELAIRGEEREIEAAAAADGLTRLELEEVARQVGIDEARFAEAVAEFEGRGRALAQTSSPGARTSVARVVQLSRFPSEREWELLVAELRETFGAKGAVTSHGGLREWSAQDVHAFIEPTEDGQRLRMTASVGSELVGAMSLGGFLLTFALLILVILLGKDAPGVRFAVPAFFGAIGSLLLGGGAVALPRWRAQREEQLARIAARAQALLATPPSAETE